MKPLKRMRRVAAVASAVFLVGWCTVLGAPAGAEPVHHHTRIEGSGSSWAAVSVDHWDSSVAQQGIGVDFNPSGSAQGRRDFAQYQNDFAVSDIGYQGTDPVTGAGDSSSRPYVYLPIVAGGTAFPYQIRVRGQLLRTLRLSGETLAKIFTLQITNWNDPEITSDNNGHALPSIPIIPVVHSEGSGSTYMFTRYVSKVYPSIWNSKFHPGPTEYFNRIGNQVAENGSDSVINFITSRAANGAIGYDEYAYALNQNYPVAKVLNASGYYTLPNQYNVAVALTQAVINSDKSSPDYLLQNLDRVYGYRDTRVYPVSSYSYMIIPTSPTDSRMAHSYKRQTIADYLYYDICRGQAPIGQLGYSSLPINLVQAGFGQIAKLHTADPTVLLTSENVATCHNPTFIAGHPEENYLAKVAPFPAACDKQGAGPCTGTTDIGLETPGQLAQNGGQNNGGNGPGSGTGPGGNTATGPGGGPTGPAGSGGNGGGPGGTGPGSTGALNPSSAAKIKPHIDPNTGQLVSGGPTTAAGNGQSAASNASVLNNAESPAVEYTLGIIAAVLLLGALIAPPLVARATQKREGGP